jgi:protein-L-isoaspartate(D-aspartate) O-methyltransferase
MEKLEALGKFFADLVTANAGVDRKNDRIRAAFAAVAREQFVGAGPWRVFTPIGYIETPTDDLSFLYQDIPVALEREGAINNGQPSLHALCISALNVQEGEVIVHVGAGAGYYTAVLSRLTGAAGFTHAFEIQPGLAHRARRNLELLRNVSVHCCSGADTHVPQCDVIYVNAGATEPVQSWLDALRVGGRLLFPLTGANNCGAMLMIKRVANQQFEAKFLCRAAFIPCAGARHENLAESLSDAFQTKDIGSVRSLRLGTPPDESCWFPGVNSWLSTAPVS